MKAVRFIAVIGLLIGVHLTQVEAIYSQNNESKQTEQSENKSENEKIPIRIEQTPNNPTLIDTKTPQGSYRIGQHDVLEVTVYKHPELSQKNIRLDESGKIRLPRIDEPISAVCKTETELSAEIIELYKKNYLREPFVTVFIAQQNSQPLSVIGAVQRPGNFFTNRRLTLLELLTYAGGQDIDRAGSKVQIARVGGVSGCNSNGENETVEQDGITFTRYNLSDVLEGKTNPVMRPGDIVVVMEAEQIYVTGNVVRPQAIWLKRPYTLTEAIAAAGGVLPASKKNNIKLVRQDPSGKVKQEQTFALADIRDKKIPDPILQANDIIEVPTDKAKDFTNNLVKALTGSVGTIFWRIP